MMEEARKTWKAQIVELQLALQLAIEELDRLEKRIAARNVSGEASRAGIPDNRIADHIALGMKKARHET